MTVAIWFTMGVILAAGISYAVVHFYRVRSEKEEPLPPEHLPADWDAVMPRSKPKGEQKAVKGSEPSFRTVGVKKGSGGGIPGTRF